WIDIPSTDLARSEAFYGREFGWTFTERTQDRVTFALITANGRLIGELNKVDTVASGNAIGIYFTVDDVPASFELAMTLGASVRYAPMGIPNPKIVGTIAEGRARDGNAIGLQSEKPLQSESP